MFLNKLNKGLLIFFLRNSTILNTKAAKVKIIQLINEVILRKLPMASKAIKEIVNVNSEALW
jgi:hypothetical protein